MRQSRSVVVRLLLSFGLAGCVTLGLAAYERIAPPPNCLEACGGDCFIGVVGCPSCDEGNPNDCFISWTDPACEGAFFCQHSCPDCYVIPPSPSAEN